MYYRWEYNSVYPYIIIFFHVKVAVVTRLSEYWGKPMELVAKNL